MAKRTCSIEGCDKPHLARGICGMHYRRWWNKNRPGVETPEQKFWQRFEPDANGCWIWTGRKCDPYQVPRGVVSVNGRSVLAHRFSYELLVGPIPEGLVIDHLCRVPLCVNPAHLEPVTIRENTLRGIGPSAQAARKTHCVHGHPLSGNNLYHFPSKPNHRACRTCCIEASRQARLKKKRQESA